ncbi:MAG: Asp-tRNA(Asn)/Glu-tRNA(Gln) amidotransferase subunit GatC [Phycisphaerales bacterium]
MGDPPPSHAPLTDADIRRVARLARLAIPQSRLAALRAELAAVLGYVERLREIDLAGVEPMAHGGADSGGANRLDEDLPGPTLPLGTLLRLAPDPLPPFIRVPRVLGEEGSA